jgi:branched-chain amino acid transport system permease protein
MLVRLIPALIEGILLGGLYGIIAVGLNLIFGVLRVVNFAHGSMLMLSVFSYYFLWKIFGFDPFFSIIIVAPAMFVLGYFLQHILIRPLFVRERALVVEPTSVLMLTTGLMFFLDNLILAIFGPNYFSITTKISSSYFNLAGVAVPWPKIIAFFGGLFLIFLVTWLLNKTEIGKVIKATAQNRDAVAMCGIDVYKIYDLTFGMGVALVSIAGAFASQMFYVQPSIGTVFGVKSFLVIVLGGLGNILGSLIGGFVFGIVEALGSQVIASSASTMLSFLLFIIILFFRPQGLLMRRAERR